jgi:hypothetical protein
MKSLTEESVGFFSGDETMSLDIMEVGRVIEDSMFLCYSLCCCIFDYRLDEEEDEEDA